MSKRIKKILADKKNIVILAVVVPVCGALVITGAAGCLIPIGKAVGGYYGLKFGYNMLTKKKEKKRGKKNE